jgi:hypothetical protein
MARPFGERAGLDDPVRTDASGVDVFISHVEEDGAVALQLADALEVAGYSTWCYERDTIPGPSYLLQTSRAIEASRAVVVLISPDSLGSHQVTSEVVRAHEEVKPFIPLLIGISHAEFGARQPEWREAVGSAATLDVPDRKVASVVPKIVDGLTALGITPHPGVAPHQKLSFATTAPTRAPAQGRGRRRLVVAGALVLLTLVAVAAVLFLALRDDGEPGSSASSPTPSPSATGATATSPTTSPSATPSGSTATNDAASTPLRTLSGPARVAARLETEYCSIGGGTCKTAPPGRSFLFLELTAWKSGDLAFNEEVSMSALQAHLSFQGVGVTPVETQILAGARSGFTVIFATVPTAAAGADVDLRWPDNPPLRVHVEG